MDFGKSIEPIKQFAISNAKAIIWLLDYLCRMENVLMNVIVSVVANHEEYEICISKDLHFCPDRRSGIIETGQSAIPTLSWILTVFSIFLATTRSCESTSRRKSTARSPSRTPPRLLPPASPPPSLADALLRPRPLRQRSSLPVSTLFPRDVSFPLGARDFGRINRQEPGTENILDGLLLSPALRLLRETLLLIFPLSPFLCPAFLA